MNRNTSSRMADEVSVDEAMQALIADGIDVAVDQVEIIAKMVNSGWIENENRADVVRDTVRLAQRELTAALDGISAPVTSRALADRFSKSTMPAGTARVLYAIRDLQVEKLAQRREIAASDLRDLERHGRFRVASELYARCDRDARTALIDDSHAHVRSAAHLSHTALATATPLLQQFAESVVAWHERSGDPTLNEFLPIAREALGQGRVSGMTSQAPHLSRFAQDVLSWNAASGDPTISDLLQVARDALAIAAGGTHPSYPFNTNISPVALAPARAVPPWMMQTMTGYRAVVRLDETLPEFTVDVNPRESGAMPPLQVTASGGADSRVMSWTRAFEEIEALCHLERHDQLEVLASAGRLFDVSYTASGTASHLIDGAEFTDDEGIGFSAMASLEKTLPVGVAAVIRGVVGDIGELETPGRKVLFEVWLRVIAASGEHAAQMTPPESLLVLVSDLMGATGEGSTAVEHVGKWKVETVEQYGYDSRANVTECDNSLAM